MTEYIAFIHPEVQRDLSDIAARYRYKMQQHNERYKRRYGEYPKTYEAELGSIQSCRFLFDAAPVSAE